MKSNATIGLWTNRGLSIEEIKLLEEKYNSGQLFPKAIREYLFLAGGRNNLGLDVYKNINEMQIQSAKVLKHYDNHINRPYFVISQYDNCMQFAFIYLDEVDEDPKVYNCYVDYIEDGVEFIEPIVQKRFVAMIDAYVKGRLINSKFYKSEG